ncbi:hypothetical protein ACXHQ9_16925 [Vibrio cincinnatiensis]
MSQYQQNNVSISSSIQVNFLSVTYVNIIADSNVHKLISRLIVAQKEFQKCIELKEPSHKLKSKAIELSSILEAIMDSSREMLYEEERKEFCKKVVESACVVIEQYKDALSIEGFPKVIVDKLYDYTRKFYEQYFGSSINDQFWFHLRCYEWFLKEGLVSYSSDSLLRTWDEPKYDYVFSEEQLEQFFGENRKEIIEIMLEHHNEHNGLIFKSPLMKEDTKQSFGLYKRISEVK